MKVVGSIKLYAVVVGSGGVYQIPHCIGVTILETLQNGIELSAPESIAQQSQSPSVNVSLTRQYPTHRSSLA